MEALAVVLCHDVEEERVCVIVRLVVEETLSQKTQVWGVTLQKTRFVTTLGGSLGVWPSGWGQLGASFSPKLKGLSLPPWGLNPSMGQAVPRHRPFLVSRSPCSSCDGIQAPTSG